jgi:hypothetical protein
MKISKSKKGIYLVSAVFLAVDLCLVIFLIYPNIKDIKTSSAEIISGKEKVIYLNEQDAQLETFKNNYQEYEPNFNKINTLFFDRENPVEFIQFLEKIAAEAGISTEINLSGPKKDDESKTTPAINFNVFTKGNFLDVLRFSEKLETSPYLVKIVKMNIKKSDARAPKDKNSAPGVEATFTLEAMAR